MMEIRDPATGKIKPVFIVASVGIIGLVLFLVMGKGSSSSGASDTSTSDSGDSSIDASSAGGGGGSVITAGNSETGFTYMPQSGTNEPISPLGDSNIPVTVGTPYAINPTDPKSQTTTKINTYSIAQMATPTGFQHPTFGRPVVGPTSTRTSIGGSR